MGLDGELCRHAWSQLARLPTDPELFAVRHFHVEPGDIHLQVPHEEVPWPTSLYIQYIQCLLKAKHIYINMRFNEF